MRNWEINSRTLLDPSVIGDPLLSTTLSLLDIIEGGTTRDYPKFNVYTGQDAMKTDITVIELAVPGFSKSDLTVAETEPGILEVKGAIEASHDEDTSCSRSYSVRGFSRSKFTKKFRVKGDVVKVQLVNGILEITIAKNKAATKAYDIK